MPNATDPANSIDSVILKVNMCINTEKSTILIFYYASIMFICILFSAFHVFYEEKCTHLLQFYNIYQKEVDAVSQKNDETLFIPDDKNIW